MSSHVRRFLSGIVTTLVFLFGSVYVSAQCVSLTTIGSAYTQNFDTLSNVAGSTTNNLTIPGWFLTESGGGACDNEQYAVDTGASTTGDMYSYGAAASTERALGQIRSGTLIPLFGACFTNNTGNTIGSLAIAYNGEQWRFGGTHSTVADKMDFQYSLNATDLVTGTWTDSDPLDFNSPVTSGIAGCFDGNAAANRTAISSSITGLSVPNGATFWIRWNDVDATGADDGIAVDDFSLTPMMATAAGVSVGGRVLDAYGKGIRGARVVLSLPDGKKFTAATNAFGYYIFDSVQSGGAYVIQPQVRGMSFSPKVVTVNDAVTDLDFSPQ